jgi:hypothetical protein
MFKVRWGRIADTFDTSMVLVSDAESLFNLYHILLGYGNTDGSVPVNIQVTNLDGRPIDMTKGLADVASQGTFA